MNEGFTGIQTRLNGINFDSLILHLNGLSKGDSDRIASFLFGLGLEVICLNVTHSPQGVIPKPQISGEVSMHKPIGKND